MTTLNDYYAGLGQSLPSVQDRAGIATKAGITDYSGTADQNNTLLGYLQKTPPSSPSGTPTITADGLTPTAPVKIAPPADNTSHITQTNATIGSLLDTTGKSITDDQNTYDSATKDLVQTILSGGDQTAQNEAIYKAQGIDQKKQLKDTLSTQIAQEQKSTADQVLALKNSPDGLTGGVQAKINLLNTESANRVANLGIGLAAATNDYTTANDIATRQITANADAIKSQITAKQFVLDQLGTKLATEKSQAFTLQTKAIDNETDQLKTAVDYATAGAKDSSIDSATAFKAVQDLTSGKISISQFYNELGNPTAGIVNGYDISSYATDPTHEQKVTSIYNTIDSPITDNKSADTVLKSLSPDTKITGTMVMNASQQYNVDPKLVISLMQQDSSLGTKGLGSKNNNPGNVGQFDSLGTTPTGGYKTLQDGVNAVAKWLSQHKATSRYNNEFASTLSTVASLTGASAANQKTTLKSLQTDIGNGDYKSAYQKIVNNVSNSLTGDNKTQFDNKNAALPAIADLKTKLQAYEDAGGKTSLLNGTFEQIQNKLGEVGDPKLQSLATDLKISMQNYRHNLSGAAFSAQEAADYASVNPSSTNKLSLNLSILDGMYSNFKRQIDSTVDSKVGDGGMYIRQYAESGTKPTNGTTQTAQPISTPAGNSYTIIQ